MRAAPSLRTKEMAHEMAPWIRSVRHGRAYRSGVPGRSGVATAEQLA